MNDLFSFIVDTEIYNFTDDNTLYANVFIFGDVISALKKGSESALQWLRNNYMAANPAKFQITFLGIPDDREITFDISGFTLKSLPTSK